MKISTAFTFFFFLMFFGLCNNACAATNQIYSDDIVQEVIDENTWHYYQIEVENPAKLTVKLRKLSDDVDLYVAQAKKPTEDNFVCAPQKSGNSIETCRLTSSTAGIWFIGIHGKTESDYQLGVQTREMQQLTQIITK